VNPVEECCFNKSGDVQTTAGLFVDDIIVTSVKLENLQSFEKALEKKYGQIKVKYGNMQPFLGMQFDFGNGFVHVDMLKFTKIVLDEFSDLEGLAETPAVVDLFNVDSSSTLLSPIERKRGYRGIQMLAWLSSHNRFELGPAVAFLKSRVSKLTQQDFSKFHRVIMYLRKYPTLRLRITGNTDYQMTAYIDTSYGVYESGHGNSGASFSMGTGTLFADSSKQKLITLSSTECELVGAVDKSKKLIWANQFLAHQRHDGSVQPAAIIMQDNQSTMKLMLKGRPLSQRTKHIDIRFFFLKERIDNGDLRIVYLRTEDMIADILTKALQGALFRRLRSLLLGE